MVESANWEWVVIAVAQAVGSVFIFLNTRATNAARTAAESAQKQLAANHILVLQTREDVRTIELATNSMKDALVQATADANLLKGRAEVTAEVAAAKLNPPAAT